MKTAKTFIVPEVIEQRIHIIRGQKVMFDTDLAKLYGVPAKRLNEQVKRNSARFPEDFMFQLTSEEAGNLRPQFATSSSRSQFATLKRGQNIKYLPYVFTEQGVAMLASVLKSRRAIDTSIAIVRVFVKLRQIASTHLELGKKLDDLERKYQKHDAEIGMIFKALRKLIDDRAVPPPSKHRIGFSV